MRRPSQLQTNAHLRKSHRQPRHTTWWRTPEAPACAPAIRTPARARQLEMLTRTTPKPENSTLVLGTSLLLHRWRDRNEAKRGPTTGRNCTLHAVAYCVEEASVRCLTCKIESAYTTRYYQLKLRTHPAEHSYALLLRTTNQRRNFISAFCKSYIVFVRSTFLRYN